MADDFGPNVLVHPFFLPRSSSYLAMLCVYHFLPYLDNNLKYPVYMRYLVPCHPGALQTSAKWMRNFVLNHKDYKRDSVVSEPIAYDLLKRIVNISNGSENADPQHLFHHTTKSSNSIPEAMYKAEAFLDQKLRQTSASEEDRSHSETVSNGLVNGE